MTALRVYIPVLDEDFPTEVAYWDGHKERLSRENPGKYLLIRGEKVDRVLDSAEELRAAEKQELVDNPALVRFVFGDEPQLLPFLQEAKSD